MFSTLRTRFGIPGVISVIALVFAMFGGAYAASNSSGGGKATASAKAKKGPRGPKGPKGDTGPAGPAGAKGDTGGAGSNGAPGAPGKDGESVKGEPIAAGGACGAGVTGVKYTVGATTTNVCNGTNGTNGAAGLPAFLPPEKTETGFWSLGPGGVGGVDFDAKSTSGQGLQQVPISFPIPLEEAPEITFVWLRYNDFASGYNEPFLPSELEEIFEEGAEHGCPGFDEGLPLAEAGHLCVYGSFTGKVRPTGTAIPNTIRSSSEPPQIFTDVSQAIDPSGSGKTAGAGKVGTALKLECLTEACEAFGAWAVTAG
jgi:hypothetical protein